MGARRDESVTADEPTVVAKPLFDPVMMEDGQGDGCFSDSTGANESGGCEVFGQTDDLLDQLVASETRPRCWGRGFAKCAGSEYKITDPPVVLIADLVCI